MRLTVKKLLLSFLTLLLLTITYLLLQSSFSLDQLRRLYYSFENYDLEKLKSDSLEIRKKLHYTNYIYSGYNNFTSHYNHNLDKIKSIPLNEKCHTFYSQLLESDPQFKFKAFNSVGERLDKSSDRKEMFFKNELNTLKNEHRKGHPDKEFIPTLGMNRTIESKYYANLSKTQRVIQSMADTATIIRVFGKCFLNNDKIDDSLNKLSLEFSKRLFPFITNSIPVFRKAGTTQENGWPVVKNDEIDYKTQNSDESIMFFRDNSKGKGIVISATSRHAKDLQRLIRILRALNNQLPIQIIFKNDINKRNMELLEAAAVADVENVLDQTTSPNEHQNHLPELNLLQEYKNYGSDFPKQDLTFVNIVSCLERGYKYSFPGYSNKVLALLFSSFEEIILLDADTIPLVPPSEFFESNEYQKSGTYFFQDRSLRDNNDFMETNFFSNLFPTNEKSIETLFNIPQVTSKTMNNKYMTGWRHFQEAGVVVFNKKQHFLGLLMMFPLSLWAEPVHSSIWGDKEMYWLGLSMAGDENYEFNSNAAASIGENTILQNRKYYPNSKSNEVCSTHPGHVNSEGKLLWINSGFSYCKKNGYFRDRVKYPFSTFENKELISLFQSPLQIKAALIPPDLPNYREPNSPIDFTTELEIKKSWKSRKKDTDEINNDLKTGEKRKEFIEDYGPQKGWVKNPICFGYMYCAYDNIESYDSNKEFDTGKFYEFNEDERRKFNYLAKIWHTGGSRTLPKKKQ
ncbi:unnamed protein product [Candida verbasci]|uniref:Alpha-1,3-mannosyltransferase n=1 Tax=Candida verbasci TaxID=1227364 RepID=A0A9W4XL96_9ASCO|nr:unnamed protein product [Candida verbasci]